MKLKLWITLLLHFQEAFSDLEKECYSSWVPRLLKKALSHHKIEFFAVYKLALACPIERIYPLLKGIITTCNLKNQNKKVTVRHGLAIILVNEILLLSYLKSYHLIVSMVLCDRSSPIVRNWSGDQALFNSKLNQSRLFI